VTKGKGMDAVMEAFETVDESGRSPAYKDHVRDALSESVVTVIFTKKDGTERTMICTTSPNLIPSESLATSDNPRKPNPAVQTVWDLQKEAWRSFRWDSIIGFHPKEQP